MKVTANRISMVISLHPPVGMALTPERALKFAQAIIAACQWIKDGETYKEFPVE